MILQTSDFLAVTDYYRQYVNKYVRWTKSDVSGRQILTSKHNHCTEKVKYSQNNKWDS